jgi:hypothetical protein
LPEFDFGLVVTPLRPPDKVHDLREASTLMLYVPLFQAPEGGATFEIRTHMDPRVFGRIP